MFLTVVYFLTDQPMEVHRFAWFTAMGLAVALCSQGLGYAIGSVFSITVSHRKFPYLDDINFILL